MANLDPTPAPADTILHLDALIVGGGFSGISALHRLRQLGLKTKIFEAGSDLGGTWYWNRYPGARVDSGWPFYQLNIPEVYKTFDFTELYPDHHELRRYFAHVDSVIDVKRDTYFNARVVDCNWDEKAALWTVRTEAGRHLVVCKYLMLCTGLLVRSNLPDFAGLGNFSGRVHHSSSFTKPLDVKGKKVAVIGMGATAVQIVQEVGKEADKLTVFMRRPSHCLPCGQKSLSDRDNTHWKGMMAALFKAGRESAGGIPYSEKPEKGFNEYTPEEREQHWETTWRHGGTSFIANNYPDILVNKEANMSAYEFWARKVRARMSDPRKMDILAPLPAERSPYHIFTKRVPLEVDFYEVVDRPTVELIDLNEDALGAFNETGVSMAKDGRQIDFDVLILATGFEAFSGSVTSMGLKNRSGTDLKEYWSDEIKTYLGMMVHGFPNAFMLYTPQAPTAFANATTLIELQADFVVSALKAIESSAKNSNRKIKSIDVTEAAQEGWAAEIEAQCAPTLLPLTESWWTGANGPTKKVQMLTYALGISAYEKECLGRLSEWKGFDVRYWDDEMGAGDVVDKKTSEVHTPDLIANMA